MTGTFGRWSMQAQNTRHLWPCAAHSTRSIYLVIAVITGQEAICRLPRTHLAKNGVRDLDTQYLPSTRVITYNCTCYYVRISLLVHDIRSKFLARENTSPVKLELFLCHSRNCILASLDILRYSTNILLREEPPRSISRKRNKEEKIREACNKSGDLYFVQRVPATYVPSCALFPTDLN